MAAGQIELDGPCAFDISPCVTHNFSRVILFGSCGRGDEERGGMLHIGFHGSIFFMTLGIFVMMDWVWIGVGFLATKDA